MIDQILKYEKELREQQNWMSRAGAAIIQYKGFESYMEWLLEEVKKGNLIDAPRS